jgi:hypothetical protein
MGVNAIVVLITSPKRSVYWDFSKQPGSTFRYMPVLTLKEMACCRKVSFRTLRVDVMRQLFVRWGGVARYVLQKAGEETQQALLDAAIAASNLQSIQDSIGKPEAADDACHRLIHQHVLNRKLTRKRMEIASKFVSDKMVQHLMSTERDRLLAFLRASTAEDEPSSVRGHLFESYAHRRLSEGGEFNVRNLATGDGATWQLPALPLRTFRVWADVQPSDSVPAVSYLRPMVRNLAAVDAIAVLRPEGEAADAAEGSGAPPPAMFLQMTISTQHPVSASGFTRTVEALPQAAGPQQLALVFVVPDDLFERFERQHYKGAASTAAHPTTVSAPQIEWNGPAVVGKRAAKRRKQYHTIVQYVLSLPLSLE